ncbi:flagellar hook-associated protein FlgL [Pelomonas sp. CA6]|uniref:flagellar hook-associated protein FlgL n=1 Tax=Pelomonas sp. CA6 TaxID=2907999 RepID=UPI001F4C4397|nr:flagellar hook-associated protein FlgL [Pelomonas sp. CA6]MCH7343994.1 flagellar hook-associated protein FlgL [Pelomonas sp. CA6]
MRLATSNMFDASISTLQQRQQRMQEAQERLTSGKRVQRASDDPTAAARAERAQTTIGQVDASKRALDASRNAMTLSESALGDANELLQQIRETMMAAGNASYSDPERAGLANKIQGLRDQLLSIANRSDGAGSYLFGGQGTDGPPFLDKPRLDSAGNPVPGGGVRFEGVAGNITTGNMEPYPISVDGKLAFEQARSGNGSFVTAGAPNVVDATRKPGGWVDRGRVTDPALLTGHDYSIQISGSAPSQTVAVFDLTTGAGVPLADSSFTPGKTLTFDGMAMTISGSPVDGEAYSVTPSTSDLRLFEVLDRAIDGLRQPNRNGAEVTQANLITIRDLDAAMGGMQTMRARVGEQLNNLDGSSERLDSLKLYNQAERSAAEDLDMTQGISDFQNQQTGYDAALKTYSMVQRMSLFQYINS